jgi:hypothetical protein
MQDSGNVEKAIFFEFFPLCSFEMFFVILCGSMV